MKTIIIGLLAIGMVAALHGQAPALDTATQYTTDQLDTLVGPIALYPDALVAIILPASTTPSDIVLAARYLQANGDPAQVASQPWDDSVKALANYPEIIDWMSDNLEWTSALGRAYLEQPVQVMESIQQLRALARANGSLVNTPQQLIVMNGGDILILPTNDDSICVPEYDPDLVFAQPTVVYTTAVIFFSAAQRVGPWLRYECDWDDYNIWLGVWHPGSPYVRDWRQSRGTGSTERFWTPDGVRQREILNDLNRPIVSVPRAHPMARAPTVAGRNAEAPTVAERNALAPTVAERNAEAPTVAERSAEGYPPSYIPSSRPDPRGWRDGNGRLAAPPTPAGPSGPNIVYSSPGTINSPNPSPPPVQPQPLPISNTGQPPAITPRPLQAPPNISAPPVNPPNFSPPRPISTQPVIPRQVRTPQPPQIHNPPPPPPTTPRPLSAPPNISRGAVSSPPPSGQLFGGYTRGTDAQNYSNRGQNSRETPAAPPVVRPASRPQAKPTTPPAARPASRPAPSSPPPAGTGQKPTTRNH